jgi:hypothetical protein
MALLIIAGTFKKVHLSYKRQEEAKMKKNAIKINQCRFWVLPLLLVLIMLTVNAYALSILPPPDFPLLEAVKKNDIEKVKSILETRKTINKFADKDPSIAVDDEIHHYPQLPDSGTLKWLDCLFNMVLKLKTAR